VIFFQISQQPGDLEKIKYQKFSIVAGYFSEVELAEVQFCFKII